MFGLQRPLFGQAEGYGHSVDSVTTGAEALEF